MPYVAGSAPYRSRRLGRYLDESPPELLLYLPLYRMSEIDMRSFDPAMHVLTRTGALWRPEGWLFDAVDDSLNCGDSTILNNVVQKTIVLVIWINTIAGAGRLCDKFGSWNYVLQGTNVIDYAQGFSGSTAEWATGNNAFALKSWYHLVLTYDRSSISNVPSLWINGKSVAMPQVTAPSGSANSDAAVNLIVGNRGAGDRPIDSIIAEVRLYKGLVNEFWAARDYLESKRRMPWLS